MNLEDLMTLARTIYGEARGEPHEAQLAVAHVIINRCNRSSDLDHTIAATCLRYKQFSCWNPDDPNRAKLRSADLGDAAFRAALAVALEAFDAATDPTLGATHFHTRDITAWWAKGREPCYEAGAHLFYNDVR